MSVEFYMGSEFDTPYERKALSIILTDLRTRFQDTSNLYIILANYTIQGHQVDITILKKDAIIVVELKDCSLPFTATENGDWKCPNGHIIGQADRNPYQQIANYRRKWKDFLTNQQSNFKCLSAITDERALWQPRGVVAISPSLHRETNDYISDDNNNKNWWFKLIGSDKLGECVSHQTSKFLDFSDNELRSIPALLHIKQVLGSDTAGPTPRADAAGLTPGGIIEPTPGGIIELTPGGIAGPTPRADAAGLTPGGIIEPTPGGIAGPTPGGIAGPTPRADAAGPTPRDNTGLTSGSIIEPPPGGITGPMPRDNDGPPRWAIVGLIVGFFLVAGIITALFTNGTRYATFVGATTSVLPSTSFVTTVAPSAVSTASVPTTAVPAVANGQPVFHGTGRDTTVDPLWYPCQEKQIKGNKNSKIYHIPTGDFYSKTFQNVTCFNTAAEAEAAGFRAARN